MKIPSKTWQNYIKKLAKINTRAAGDVVSYMVNHDVSTYEGTKALIDYAYAVSTKYGEAAAELSCQMYDAIATVSRASVPAAEPAATATYGEIARTIYGTLASTKSPEAIGSAVGRSVKLASVDTLQKNALRDGAEWAWIPAGDTCPFCLMLASRGWVKASKKAIKNGHAEHVHSNCDCTYCVRFDHETTVEGYDPDGLYDQYINAGDTPKERLNALSRQHYAANKEYINAQKRAAYARKNNKPEDERVLTERLAITYNNSPDFIPLHTVITEPYAIAGKGTNTPIRDVNRLVAVYKKDAGEWKKMVGKIKSDKYQFDIHWYECDDKIVLEPKIKSKKERK